MLIRQKRAAMRGSLKNAKIAAGKIQNIEVHIFRAVMCSHIVEDGLQHGGFAASALSGNQQITALLEIHNQRELLLMRRVIHLTNDSFHFMASRNTVFLN